MYHRLLVTECRPEVPVESGRIPFAVAAFDGNLHLGLWLAGSFERGGIHLVGLDLGPDHVGPINHGFVGDYTLTTVPADPMSSTTPMLRSIFVSIATCPGLRPIRSSLASKSFVFGVVQKVPNAPRHHTNR